MAMRLIYSILVIAALFSCKKSDERSCWKGHGEESSLEIPLDSVASWNLGKGITYRIYQDSLNKLVVKGGENMITQIRAENDAYDLRISNENKCHFLRDGDRGVEVEIHYPYYKEIYAQASDSITFEDTITSDTLRIEMAFAGGSMDLAVDLDYLWIVVSVGTGDYTLRGQANRAEVKSQDMGFADASEFTTNAIFVYQNSTADMYVNFENSAVYVLIDGTGNVYAKGEPAYLTTDLVGSGQIIQY